MSGGSSSGGPRSIQKMKHDEFTSVTTSRSLLSRLSNEILVELLAYLDSNDTCTLRNVCIAVKSDKRLYQLARVRRWQQVTIDEQDLIPAPGRDVEVFKRQLRQMKRLKVGNNWKPRGHNVGLLIKDVDGTGSPANHIKELTFDLRMFRYFSPEIQQTKQSVWHLVPSSESLQHSLGLLKPHLTGLRAVKCNGEIPQDILDMVGDLAIADRLSSLELQSYYGPGRLQGSSCSSSGLGSLQRVSNDLKPIRSFIHLKSLEIHRLTVGEVPSLLETLPKLRFLDYLLVADEFWEARPRRMCAIKTLFDYLIGSGDRFSTSSDQSPCFSSALPLSLKTLKCMDRHYHEPRSHLEEFGMQGPMRGKSDMLPLLPAAQLDSNIVNLYIDTDLFLYVPRLLQSFKCPQLRVLSVAGATDPYRRDPQFVKLDEVISLHESTLERIDILQAWTLDATFSDDFNRRWSGKYSIQELVLGFPSHFWDENLRPEGLEGYLEDSASALADCLNAIHPVRSGNLINPVQWGDDLRRIRIDHIVPLNIDTRVLRHPRFDGLKILMLQPFDDLVMPDGGMYQWSDNSCWYIDEASARLLTNSIASDASRALRIVVLQNYWYWIPEPDLTSLSIKCMTWQEAQEDPDQARAISEIVSETDWIFLRKDSPPFWNTRFHPDLNLSPEYPKYRKHSVSIVRHQWNYLTALPSNTEYGGERESRTHEYIPESWDL